MPLTAAVLVRPILDPESPAGLRIDPATRRPVFGGPLVLGAFERSALEVAMRLKDSGAVGQVTVFAAFADSTAASSVLRKALSVGADEAVMVEADVGALDALPAAEVLARALERRGPFDIVLAGRQAGDWESGQTGYLLAERLGWPSIALVREAWIDGDELQATRNSPLGIEQVGVAPPAVLVVTAESSNVLRLARVPDLMTALRKPMTKLSLADVGVADLDELSGLEVREVRQVDSGGQCEFVPGETAAEVVHSLASRLLEIAPS